MIKLKRNFLEEILSLRNSYLREKEDNRKLKSKFRQGKVTLSFLVNKYISSFVNPILFRNIFALNFHLPTINRVKVTITEKLKTLY